MSLCGLGISCEPITDIKEVCEHGIVVTFPCDWCAIHKLLAELHVHKIRQIDENRKISNRVDELEKVINYISNHTNDENVNKRRIDELEAAYKADYETARDIIFQGAQTHASILRCEAKIKELESSDYDERISDLEKIGVESRLLKVESGYSKKPYICPRCSGSGRYRLATSGSLSDVIDCRSCEGTGILWG